MTAYEPPDGPGTEGYDAVVLAGGAARRLGGADKPGVRVGGRALLDRVLAACAGARTIVVVADPRPTARPVLWAREEPPGGGPLAALDAGLRRTTAPYVVVLSADLPFLAGETVRRLLDTLRGSAVPPVRSTTSGAAPCGGTARPRRVSSSRRTVSPARKGSSA
ncbi:molybdenum cofactor guanylyltransferase, partial [Streptomyces neyagawaensis]|uniref:molybdenum cofactor guanylyltransferase n=1 Tax=Streptomyces neyagawaensis TaxID=42238 RepID=UPI000A66AA47